MDTQACAEQEAKRNAAGTTFRAFALFGEAPHPSPKLGPPDGRSPTLSVVVHASPRKPVVCHPWQTPLVACDEPDWSGPSGVGVVDPTASEEVQLALKEMGRNSTARQRQARV